MISLSTRAKNAIKTGLAMTIAYGIALYMDWEKPYWAGFDGIFSKPIRVNLIKDAIEEDLKRNRLVG